jgi:integrase
MDVLLDALGYQARQPHQEDVSTSSTDALRGVTSGCSRSSLPTHDLRHVGGTLAATTGASLKELMARLGHSSTRAALIYQHATRDRDKAIALALGDLVRQVRSAQSGEAPEIAN